MQNFFYRSAELCPVRRTRTQPPLTPRSAGPPLPNSPVREPAIQAFWREEGIYAACLANAAGAERFTLHDGPPYANGSLHMGHALNKARPPPSALLSTA